VRGPQGRGYRATDRTLTVPVLAGGLSPIPDQWVWLEVSCFTYAFLQPTAAERSVESRVEKLGLSEI